MVNDSIRVVRLEDVLPELSRQRTLQDAFIEINQQKIALQAIKNVVDALQSTIHRLQSKGDAA